MNVIDLGPDPDERLDETERYLLHQIALLQEEYRKAAAPYFEQLSRLNAIRPRRYMVIAPQSVPLGTFDGAIPAPIGG